MTEQKSKIDTFIDEILAFIPSVEPNAYLAISHRLDRLLMALKNREECLKLAHSEGVSPEQVVKTARIYEAYLDGK